jgi:hypothetical protein
MAAWCNHQVLVSLESPFFQCAVFLTSEEQAASKRAYFVDVLLYLKVLIVRLGNSLAILDPILVSRRLRFRSQREGDIEDRYRFLNSPHTIHLLRNLQLHRQPIAVANIVLRMLMLRSLPFVGYTSASFFWLTVQSGS